MCHQLLIFMTSLQELQDLPESERRFPLRQSRGGKVIGTHGRGVSLVLAKIS